MDPITWTVIGVLAALGAGFGVGWGARGDRTADVLEQHSQALDVILDTQTEIVSAVSEPMKIDAELRAELADTPVQCVKTLGGDPMSVQCQWATCLQYGQTSAQRPECSDLVELLTTELGAAGEDQR